MRMTTPAIRGSRPTTRFAAVTGLRLQRQFGLRRSSPIIRPAEPVRLAGRSPLAALHDAVRGVARPPSIGRSGRPVARVLTRADAMRWSGSGNSAGTAHRARPRSAAPWRG
jgi:hypothetical protein